jgi:hypothetical protein
MDTDETLLDYNRKMIENASNCKVRGRGGRLFAQVFKLNDATDQVSALGSDNR